MSNYQSLSREIQNKIREDRANHWENPYAAKNENVMRRYMDHDKANLWRPAYVRDCEKVMHNPYYNRYSDKTQVFSFMKNDDISRRAQHVQLVSRIARNIGSLLGLNIDLIEAISLGHDIGHTPFGHAGERILDDLYCARTGRHFNHNIQSSRVFTAIFPVNMSLQTLDGIICHNGELELQEYRPSGLYNQSVKLNAGVNASEISANQYEKDFALFDKIVEETYINPESIGKLVPATLEGCVMRVSDIIAYLGKDRQDAMKIGLIEDDSEFFDEYIGKGNAEMINNIIVNIVENSYGKPYIAMNEKFFEGLKKGKKQNGNLIYSNSKANNYFNSDIKDMFEQVYEKLLEDYTSGNKNSVIFKHHINYIESYRSYYRDRGNYQEEEPNAIVTDYIASMTDDYFMDLYDYLFPNKKHKVIYTGYFEE